MMSGGAKTVCVTGASGFIASWIVKLLLQRGYAVKATVRDPNDVQKTEHLLRLDGANERLSLFKADLKDDGSFDHVIEECEGVFHTASPSFLTTPSDPQAELIDPAVKGTLNVLKSCARVSSIRRVVITSSLAAVVFNGKPLIPETVVDDTWFTDPILCEKLKLWYMLSKTLAENAAWKFAKENGIDLVAMNPGLVIGPLLQPTLNSSMEVIPDIVNGKSGQFGTIYRFVDVRDVASAHIKAFEDPSANGRYCLVGHIMTLDETLKILRQLSPDSKLPERGEESRPDEPRFQISQEKRRSLGVNFTPVEVTLRDTVESLKEKGLMPI